jgi:hypothetical protein
MDDNRVAELVTGAHNTLEKAIPTTQTVEGNPTATFSSKKTELNIPQAHKSAPYSMARAMRMNSSINTNM